MSRRAAWLLGLRLRLGIIASRKTPSVMRSYVSSEPQARQRDCARCANAFQKTAKTAILDAWLPPLRSAVNGLWDRTIDLDRRITR